VTAAALVLSPVIYYGYLQREAVGWLTRPGPHAVARLTASFAGSKTLAPLVAAIALCGVIGSWPHRGGRELTLAAVALPWLLLPAAVLFAASRIHPVYSPRYVTVSLPALALLAAAGLSWLARVAARSPLANIGTWLAWAPPVLIIALMGALLVGPQRAVRQPNSRHGTGKVAAIIAVNGHPGDAVLYVPSRQRAMTYAGPAVWARLRDIALARSPAASATLAGTEVSPAVLPQRFFGVDRVWLVTRRNVVRRKVRLSPMSRIELRLAGAMHLIGQWRAHSTVLRLYCSAAAANVCSVETPRSQGSRHPCPPLPRASTA
jgi:mannosyltransferase